MQPILRFLKHLCRLELQFIPDILRKDNIRLVFNMESKNPVHCHFKKEEYRSTKAPCVLVSANVGRRKERNIHPNFSNRLAPVDTRRHEEVFVMILIFCSKVGDVKIE
jgi:hypothetical protein